MESNMRANGDGPRHFESLQLTHLPPLRKREDSELRQNLRASAPSARRICKSSKKVIKNRIILQFCNPQNQFFFQNEYIFYPKVKKCKLLGGDGFRNFELRSSDEDDTSALKHLPNANDMDVLGIKVLTLMCLGVMRLGFHPIISPWPQIMKPYLVVSGGRKSVQ
ncbi:hypothetical protein TNCV_2607391 [Trichonephila clavipes]|uniref:Uncharacterized protein n=1 Tax=Trichonephila clavipes TaxID=2585209 RepID=A0A8X6RZA2_TRICX|nr:hypothetical protein TNCV_2607391 [Trichonephila clavipes]